MITRIPIESSAFSDLGLCSGLCNTHDSHIDSKNPYDGEMSHVLGLLRIDLERLRGQQENPNAVEVTANLIAQLVKTFSPDQDFGLKLRARIISTKKFQDIFHDDALEHFEKAAAYINDAQNHRGLFEKIQLTDEAVASLAAAERGLREFVQELRPQLAEQIANRREEARTADRSLALAQPNLSVSLADLPVVSI